MNDATSTPRISTMAGIRRALKEAPQLGHRLWLIVLLNAFGTLVHVLVPVLIQQTVDRDSPKPSTSHRC